MGFLAIANAYTMRVCLSVAITQMVKPLNYTVNDGSAVCEADPDDHHSSGSSVRFLFQSRANTLNQELSS